MKVRKIIFCLNIIEEKKLGLFSSLKNIFFFNNKLTVYYKKIHDLEIGYIDVYLRHKKIPWNKILNILGSNKGIICSENIKIPNNLGIYRYYSNKLNSSLCKKVALNVLKNAKPLKGKLRFILYDPKGIHLNFLKYIIDFFRDIIVVSDNCNVYLNLQKKVLTKFGASILLTENRDWTRKGDFIVAPDKIEEVLQIAPHTVIFTGEKSLYSLGGKVFDRYDLSDFTYYDDLIPYKIDKSYFFNVLFDVCQEKVFKDMNIKNCFCDNKRYSIYDIHKNLICNRNFLN